MNKLIATAVIAFGTTFFVTGCRHAPSKHTQISQPLSPQREAPTVKYHKQYMKYRTECHKSKEIVIE